MASSSVIMLSNVSMERLYLSQPPGWNDLQRLSYSLTQSQQQSQQDNRSNQQLFRTCYDKLLHHMYDINSPSSSTITTTSTINQINEQLELAAEYCQLKTYRDGNTVYLHSDQFHLEVNFDALTHLPTNIASCFINEEPLICTNMLKALNEKQYKLFREHLNGYSHLFTLIAPNLNNEKRIGYMTYKILQQDLERLSKTDPYSKLFEGFQPMFEGLPMSIKLGDEGESIHLRIVIVPSANQHYLPIKTSLCLDEKTNTIQIDSSLKSSTLATGHFALEFDENQPAFTFLQTFAQDISRVTNISSFLSSEVKTFNYLSTLLPKNKSLHHYRWYVSHDQPAISIRQIPFTNLKQLIQILNFVRQQSYLTKYLNIHLNRAFDDEPDHMEEEHATEISFELSLLSSTILSITCAQEQYLSTFLLRMSDIESLPVLIHRLEQKEYEITNERNALFKLIEKLLQQTTHAPTASSSSPKNDLPPHERPARTSPLPLAPPKLNRRLSCVPPAKPTWRRATTLRRNQPACLTLNSTLEKSIDEPMVDEPMHPNVSTDDFPDEEDDDPFLQLTEQQLQTQPSYHTQILPKPLLSFHPSTLSRCTSVSSTQSVSTPPIFGLSPSTPYPGGANNPNGNVFFPLGKQVSMPEYSPVSSPITMGTLDPLAFLPANSLPQPPTNDPNSKNPQQKKKRRRSEHSADDFIQAMNSDNRPSMSGTKLNSSGGTDPSNIKRGKKPMDKNAQQQQQQQQLVRQKSAFKVTDSPTATLLSQQSVTSPDDTSNELKPLKVVIKRVEGSGNSSTDESQQQQTMKQRKKQQQQSQQMGNNSGSLPGTMRKLPSSNAVGAAPSIVVKTESMDVPQIGPDSNSMMSSGDGSQQALRERPRPSSSLANPSSSLSAASASQPRSAPPQPPIVLKIQRSKVYSGQEQTSSAATTPITATATQGAAQPSNSIPSVLKEALKHRVRAMPTGPNTAKSQVTSPTTLAAKLTSPSTGTTSNPLAPPSTVTSLFRIPKKSSSQDVTVKPKIEPGTVPPANNNTSPVISKTPLLPGPGVRPPLPPTQVGSWQSPPTQQASRFNQNRPRQSWSQQPPPPPRVRAAITPPNVSAMNAGHSSMNNFSQQPRSILKKPPSNEASGSDLLYMPPSDLSGFNDSRMGSHFPGSTSQNRTTTPTEMYDDNDDDTSPQAQLVIDTSSTTANNVLLPYTIVPGSSSSAGMDGYDRMHENNSMMNSSQQHMGDESFSNLD